MAESDTWRALGENIRGPADETGRRTNCAEQLDHSQFSHLADFKSPKRVMVGALSRTATGKIRKYALQAHAKTL